MLQTTDCFADAAEAIELPAISWSPSPPPPAFTTVELRVIALAARDTLASLDVPSRLGRFVALLFGRRGTPAALADPRLEALRHAAVVARHRRHLPDGEALRLRDHGFAEAQLRALEALSAADHLNR